MKRRLGPNAEQVEPPFQKQNGSGTKGGNGSVNISSEESSSNSPSPNLIQTNPSLLSHQSQAQAHLSQLLKFPNLQAGLLAGLVGAAATQQQQVSTSSPGGSSSGNNSNNNNNLNPAELVKAAATGGDALGSQAQRIASLLANMKGVVPPISLNSSGGGPPPPPHSGHLPFSPEMLWRYPNPFLPQPPPSPLETALKAHLPGGLGGDPRSWNRDDVAVFLRHCEREFDLEKIDMDRFQMNGKALCLLNKTDLDERCPGGGVVIHITLQSLLKEASVPTAGSFLPPPSSPLTPRAPAGLITPTSPAFPQSPHWPFGAAAMAQAAQQHAQQNEASSTTNNPASSLAAAFPGIGHLISATNSVTMSPANSIDTATNSSPKSLIPEANPAAAIRSIHQLFPTPMETGMSTPTLSVKKNLTVTPANGDSDEELKNFNTNNNTRSPRTPTLLLNSTSPRSPNASTSPSSSSKNEEANNANNNGGAPGAGPELNTNGRLLWDFLQQLLNDAQQRYTSYIAWKDKETGVFKIVDPAGLAKLWGIQKNHLSMNYDKMSRALRYYYRVNILRKVQGERHCYQFLRNPSELKSIKNISLLRQQMEAQAAANKIAAQQLAAQQQQQAAAEAAAQAAAAAAGFHTAVVGRRDSTDEPIDVDSSSSPTNEVVNNQGARPATPSSSSSCPVDEPTDLTMDTEEKQRRRGETKGSSLFPRNISSMLSPKLLSEERRGSDGSSGDNSPRGGQQGGPMRTANGFDFRSLIPQVSLKSDY